MGETLAFAVKDHFLVPKHYQLSAEQTEEILKKLSIKKEQLPVISKADPAVKEFKPAKGDVFKIVRNSQMAGKTLYYRRVG